MNKHDIPFDEPGSPAGEQAINTQRRTLLSAGAALGLSATFARSALAAGAAVTAGKDLNFAASLGWITYDSGRHLQNGYKDAVGKLGGRLTMSDAGGDPKRQSDQIDALVSSRPHALFITPADAAAIAPAVSRALKAGIPVFAADSMVPGVAVDSTVLSNNFGMGYHTAEYIAKRLNGKGNVAVVSLPQNESWDQRTAGMQFAFSRYPNIKVLGSWAYSATASTTPRQAVDSLLTTHPDLNAVWCAWDGASIQGALAVKAAQRKVFLTGIDGGKQAFEYIRSDTAMALTMAQSFYEMAYLSVRFAHQKLAGEKVPRLVISPVYAVTRDTLLAQPTIADNYDVPGEASKLGWQRAL